MSEKEPEGSSSSTTPASEKPRCYLCGTREAPSWHHYPKLGASVCGECHDLVSPPSTMPAVKPPK